eukprot:sb/3470501/
MGRADCDNCPRDSYNEETGKSVCVECPDNLQTKDDGAASKDLCTCNSTECSDCGFGKFTGDSASTECDSCKSPQTTYGKQSTKESDCEGPRLSLTKPKSKRDQINVKEGDTYKQGDGQKDTPAVLAAKSFYAHFPNVFCQMKGYSNEYRGSRARDADGNTCKSECRSDDADKEPTCEVEGTGEKKICGIPRCIWDSQCYTGLGG